MSEPSTNHSAVKKKNKKRKKKTKGQQAEGTANGQQDHTENMPKQASGDQVITTTKCSRCKGTFRQMVQNGAAVTPTQPNWICPSCVQAVKAEEIALQKTLAPSTTYSATSQPSVVDSVTGGCNCAACVAKRENSVTPEVEKEAHITQTQWMEIRQIVRCIYRENMMLSNQTNRASIGSDKMKLIVKKLCSRDPHQFFQRLETLAREYLLEVKVRLLEQLSCGFNSPQLAIEFIQMLLDEYSSLCNSLPALLYLLEPLEECEYVQKLGMTIELMNKNIFRELIFAESFMNSNLPLIIAQLRLASLASEPYHRNTADELNQRYMALDQEMDAISHIWRSAKDHLNTHQDLQRKQLEKKKAHFEKIRADGESFKQMKRQQQQASDTKSKEDKENSRPETPEDENTSLSPKDSASEIDPTALPTMSNSIHSVLTSASESLSLKSKQAVEWSRLLFKCIKPVGEPEFRLNGDIATHTITLHLDMTELDLTTSKPCCTRGDLNKYRKLGLSVEEVVEVTMKLNALKTLGINLKIEDLFDDEGFSLADINETLVGSDHLTTEISEDVYFIDDEIEAARYRQRVVKKEKKGDVMDVPLSLDEEVDLNKTWERILLRQETTNGRSRQHDFLQGMTMKIRFMKRLTVEDLDKNFLADGGRVIFNACDQVQMKLTQLELNSVRLVTNGDCIGDDLGLQNECNDSPLMRTLKSGEKTAEDYAFVHTDSHKEFMDLLLEKRKHLETLVSNKQREKRAKEKESVALKDGDSVGLEDSTLNEVLRYEIKEQQESSIRLDPPATKPSVQQPTPTGGSVSEKGSVGLSEFKPVYLSNSSQPCQCSACVGAVAATIQPSYCRPLNPTDPSAGSVTIECSLSAHLGGKLPVMIGTLEDEKSKQISTDKNAKKRTPPLSKEGLWQNWMSTSGSAQIENESQIHNGSSHHHHHHHHHHSHYNCCHGDGGVEGDSGYGDSLRSSCSGTCECRHDHPPPNSTTTSSTSSPHVLPCSSSHNHTGTSSPVSTTTTTCQTSTTSSNGGGGTGASNDSMGNSSESSRRYCPCCYCELFGHNGPPTAPTSHNFTKQRDKMRAKLEDKRKKRDHGSSKGHGGDLSGAGKETSVEELLAFIEGEGDNEQQTSARAAKRQRRKQKKQASTQPEETIPCSQQNGSHQTTPHSSSPDLPNGSKAKPANGGKGAKKQAQQQHQPSGKENSRGQERKAVEKALIEMVDGEELGERKMSMSSTESDLDNSSGGGDIDDYDDELEEFKKFCFASAPVENRKKIAIPLNMNAFMSKVK